VPSATWAFSLSGPALRYGLRPLRASLYCGWFNSASEGGPGYWKWMIAGYSGWFLRIRFRVYFCAIGRRRPCRFTGPPARRPVWFTGLTKANDRPGRDQVVVSAPVSGSLWQVREPVCSLILCCSSSRQVISLQGRCVLSGSVLWCLLSLALDSGQAAERQSRSLARTQQSVRAVEDTERVIRSIPGRWGYRLVPVLNSPAWRDG